MKPGSLDILMICGERNLIWLGRRQTDSLLGGEGEEEVMTMGVGVGVGVGWLRFPC